MSRVIESVANWRLGKRHPSAYRTSFDQCEGKILLVCLKCDGGTPNSLLKLAAMCFRSAKPTAHATSSRD